MCFKYEDQSISQSAKHTSFFHGQQGISSSFDVIVKSRVGMEYLLFEEAAKEAIYSRPRIVVSNGAFFS